jgi:hypothetical protein
VSFRVELGLGAVALGGMPLRALAGWLLSLFGLILSVVAVRGWLASARLGGRHRHRLPLSHPGAVGPTSRHKSWPVPKAGTAAQAGGSSWPGGASPGRVTTAADGGGVRSARANVSGPADAEGWAGAEEPAGLVGWAGAEEPAGGGEWAGAVGWAESAERASPDAGSDEEQARAFGSPGADLAGAAPAGGDHIPASLLPAGRPRPAGGTDPKPGKPGGKVPSALSPAARQLLGLRQRTAGPGRSAGHPVQHLEVALGSYRIEVLLAEAPASDRTSRSAKGQTWIASAPYLVWTPLPHDFPSDGGAFACLGAGDQGCLFIDLAAAPGAVVLAGDQVAATRLAESIAHQLCAGPAAGSISVVVVGSALPPPPPLGAEWVASVGDLLQRGPGPDGRQIEIVFCRIDSNDDVFPLARHVARARHRVVPVVLADLPGAPWSFIAHPSPQAAEVLQSLVS